MTELTEKTQNQSITLLNRLLAEELAAISVFRVLRAYANPFTSTMQSIESRHRQTADVLQSRIETLGGVAEIEPSEVGHWQYFLWTDQEEPSLAELKKVEERSIAQCREALRDLVLDERMERFIETVIFQSKWENVHDLDKLIVRRAA